MPRGNKSRDKTQIQHNKDGAIILRAATHYQNGTMKHCGYCQTTNKKGADFSSILQFQFAVMTAALALVLVRTRQKQRYFFA
jgi:hypothetical protein